MNNIGVLLPLLIILMIIPMFLNGRKQKRQMQEMQELQRNLTDGDYVWTTSGLRGKVVDTSYEDSVDLEIADGLVTTWKRVAVLQKVSPASEDGSSDDNSSPGAPASEHGATNGTGTAVADGSEAASGSASGNSGSTVGEGGGSRPPHLQ